MHISLFIFLYSLSGAIPYDTSDAVPQYSGPAAYPVPQAEPSAVPAKITLLHTNDIHAHMEEFNYGGTSCNNAQIANNRCFGGVARIKTVVDAYRANTTDLILLDAGDQFQGTLFFNTYGGNVSSLVMNLLRYDAMTIGNHEFDNGVESLADFIMSLNFSVISSNIDITQPNLTAPLREAGVKPYIIMKKYNLGIIGFITNTTATIIANGVRFKESILDPVSTVQKYVDDLHSQGIYRIICLSHNGYKDDVYLAQHVKGVQLIVGGHSHSYLSKNASDPRTEGPYPTRTISALDGKSVYVVQAHRYGDYLGHLELEWDSKDQLISVCGDPIVLDQTIPKDSALNATIVKYAQAFTKLSTDILTHSTADFPGGCRAVECAMGDILTDCMISEQAGLENPVQIAFINTGGIRAAFSKGPVTAADVLNVLPFGNTIANFRMSGAQLSAMLDRWAGNGSKDKALISKPQISGGLVWNYNASKPAGSRVISARVGGYDINPAATYQMSTIDFVLNGGDNIVLLKPEIMPPPGLIVADLFTSCLRKKPSISPSLDNRTTSI